MSPHYRYHRIHSLIPHSLLSTSQSPSLGSRRQSFFQARSTSPMAVSDADANANRPVGQIGVVPVTGTSEVRHPKIGGFNSPYIWTLFYVGLGG